MRAIGQSLPDLRVLTPQAGRRGASEYHLVGDGMSARMEELRAADVPYRQDVAAKRSAGAAEASARA